MARDQPSLVWDRRRRVLQSVPLPYRRRAVAGERPRAEQRASLARRCALGRVERREPQPVRAIGPGVTQWVSHPSCLRQGRGLLLDASTSSAVLHERFDDYARGIRKRRASIIRSIRTGDPRADRLLQTAASFASSSAMARDMCSNIDGIRRDFALRPGVEAASACCAMPWQCLDERLAPCSPSRVAPGGSAMSSNNALPAPCFELARGIHPSSTQVASEHTRRYAP